MCVWVAVCTVYVRCTCMGLSVCENVMGDTGCLTVRVIIALTNKVSWDLNYKRPI